MNADLHKIRKSKLFRSLPDRAFERISSHIKVRSYMRGEDFVLKSGSEFSRCFGYVISGRMLFVGAGSQPLGLANKDEFFLGRPFTLNDVLVERLVSAADMSLVVFVPKQIIASLSAASIEFSALVEEIYESIFDRAKVISSDPSAMSFLKEFVKQTGVDKNLTGWIANLEEERTAYTRQVRVDDRHKRLVQILCISSAVILCWSLWEMVVRSFGMRASLVGILKYYSPVLSSSGARLATLVGVVGYIFILLTSANLVVRLGTKKWNWKIDLQSSSYFHLFFGVTGFGLICLHSIFYWHGFQWGIWAFCALLLSFVSGMVGQFISEQIPKSIRGDSMRLESLRAQQRKLQRQAEMLMDDTKMYQTSVNLLSGPVAANFWMHLLAKPRLWLVARKIRTSLKELGLAPDTADFASSLVIEQFDLEQKIRFLEIANRLLRRWMYVHIPLSYLVYILGTIHVVLISMHRAG